MRSALVERETMGQKKEETILRKATAGKLSNIEFQKSAYCAALPRSLN